MIIHRSWSTLYTSLYYPVILFILRARGMQTIEIDNQPAGSNRPAGLFDLSILSSISAAYYSDDDPSAYCTVLK